MKGRESIDSIIYGYGFLVHLELSWEGVCCT